MMETRSTPTLPRLNEPAPEFAAVTTHGLRKLSDYTAAGTWVLLFSHPADFTPVCTTEFVAFARRTPEFERRGVQLVGLSIDSVPAHLAWIRDIEETFDVRVTFPVIADPDTKDARQYGMLHPGASTTATVRAVFAIDPKGILRAMLYYPLTTGRPMDELLRLIDALQATDAHGVSTPACWRPGEPVVVPAPATAQALADEEARRDEYDYRRWYLRLKPAV